MPQEENKIEQNGYTKAFIQAVEALTKTGEHTYASIIKDLEWNKSGMSLVMNGYRNIPYDKYEKFTSVYNYANSFENKDTDVDYREKYIRLLEKSLEAEQTIKKALVGELEKINKKIDDFGNITQKLEELEKRTAASLVDLSEFAKRRMVQLRTIQRSQAEHRAKVEKVPLEEMVEHTNNIQSEEHDRIFSAGNF